MGIVGALFLCPAIPANAQVVQWTRQFGTAGPDFVIGMATGPNAVYAVGQVAGGAFTGFTNAGKTDAFVTKLDPAGAIVWTKQFGTAEDDIALGAAADASGVYVVGHTQGGLQGVNLGGEDVIVRKYDTNGNAVWTRQFGSTGNDKAWGAAVDATGLYVTGEVTGSLPGQTAHSSADLDAFLRKYDFNGNELWTRQFGTIDAERGYGVATDNNGVYVAGETNGEFAPPAVGGSDYFLRRFDTAGNTIWTRQFGSDTSDGANYGGGVAVDSTGVYVTGGTVGTLAGQTKIGGLWDAFLAKFDLNGKPAWMRQFGTDADDWGFGVALGGGFVNVAGQGANAALWRFDINGGQRGKLDRGAGNTYAQGIASDSSGVYVGGLTSFTNLGETVYFGDSDAFVFKVPHPPVLSGVGDAFTGQSGTAPTTWTALYGSGLATVLRTWDGAISGSQLPTSLDEVRVTINGKPATIYFVSPGQVNVLAPLDTATGNVEIVLTNRYGTSAALQVRKANYLPAFYAPFGESTGLRVTAVALDGALVGKVGLDPRVTRGARPGEILQMFATGFGPTNPAAPSDLIFSGAPVVANATTITIGGKAATFAGNGNLVAPGLYQFNVTIPDLADGDHAINATAGGATSAVNVFLSVKR